ncbi:MAG: AraC family transcriptional regulator ligand-binding domain-containing protein [Betaproteobacteria bacterium]|nr:AraC family transcriptional regulator ligand-binding domain-containing protein [Betaproteobacteria bacterium]
MDPALEELPCPSTYSRMLLRRWQRQTGTLLRGTGLDAHRLLQETTVSVRQQLQILRNAKRLAGTRDWALEFGHELNINSHGPLGFAAVSAKTLSEGLDVFGQFVRIRAPYVNASTSSSERNLILRFDADFQPLDDLEIPLIEILLQVASAYVVAVLGQDVSSMALYFRHGARGYASRYARFFKGSCEFNADFNGVVLPASFRAIECPLHDESIYRSSILRCREALEAVLAPDDVVARTKHWLAKHFDQIATNHSAISLPRLEQLAEVLCVTPRTLIRQLAHKGVCFSDLRTAQQLDIAQRMLDDARYSASEIGALLGYDNPANFARAFRRLTGMAPGEFRRRKRSE